YGEPPQQVHNLIAVSRLRRMAQKTGLSEVVTMGPNLRVATAELADSIQVRLQRLYPGARYFTQTKSVSVPMPRIHGEPLGDAALVEWTSSLLVSIFGAEVIRDEPADRSAEKSA
ncbi:MAG: hypothetical protein H7146_06020, partial [Burkholderiaceae bacterium]|nr:hypothetical protein [Microbacteriaceae bacterium]